MAIEHTTRRALLGAIAAAPIIATVSFNAGEAATSPTQWDAAMSSFIRAKAAYDMASPGYHRKINPTLAEHEHIEKLCDALGDTEATLMETPAPHMAALAWKMERLLEDDGTGYTASISLEWAAPALADLRRLAGRSH